MSGYCEGCGNTLCVCPMTAHDGATSPIRDVDPPDVDDARRNGIDPRAVEAAAEALTLIPGTTVTYPESVARTVLAAAAPILLAAERQRIAAAIRANHQRAYHLDSTAGPLCICGRLHPCPDTAAAARIAEGDPGTSVVVEGDR